jgi:low affinity Fe/Cu permease
MWLAGRVGPFSGFSDTRALITNMVIIVTFLMVFLIQNTQARDSAASQAQLMSSLKRWKMRTDATLLSKR